jgi:hypothetical protein
MNIFFLDADPSMCAKMHNNSHTIKMILEYCQLLSTAHRVLDGVLTIQKTSTNRNIKRYVLHDERNEMLYSATHINHPSAVWVRQSAGNYSWLTNLLVELCSEYTYRYGKVHKSQQIGLVKLLHNIHPINIPMSPFTEPTCAMPDEVKIQNDSISSYRNYYNLNKTHLASWKGKVNSRSTPFWYTPNTPYVNL